MAFGDSGPRSLPCCFRFATGVLLCACMAACNQSLFGPIPEARGPSHPPLHRIPTMSPAESDTNHTDTNSQATNPIEPNRSDAYIQTPEQQAATNNLQASTTEEKATTPSGTSSGGGGGLDLAQCRVWALRDNLSIAVERVAPQLAAERLAESEARFEATFFANANHTERTSPSSTQLEGTDTQNTQGQLGVNLPLQTGGTLTFDATGNRSETDNQFSLLNPAYNSGMGVSLSQPLLRNAGRHVNTAPIQIARLDQTRVDAQTRLAVIRILAEVDRAYWQLVAARKLLDVREAQHNLAEKQLERAEHLVEQGSAAEVEILRAQAGVAQGLEATIVAENQLRQAQRQLKQLLNQPSLPIEDPTPLVPTTDMNPVAMAIDREALLATAMDERMELLELEIQLVQDALNIDINRNATLPLAVLEYRYGKSGLDNQYDQASKQLFSENFDSHTLGLLVEIPLGNQQAKAALNQALLTRLQRTATKALRTQQIKQEVLTAADNLEAAWQRVLASRQSAILEARVLDAEARQFEQGLNTSTDVLDAQTRLANAQASEVQALADYQIAQIDLAFATGQLLGSAQVLW